MNYNLRSYFSCYALTALVNWCGVSNPHQSLVILTHFLKICPLTALLADWWSSWALEVVLFCKKDHQALQWLPIMPSALWSDCQAIPVNKLEERGTYGLVYNSTLDSRVQLAFKAKYWPAMVLSLPLIFLLNSNLEPLAYFCYSALALYNYSGSTGASLDFRWVAGVGLLHRFRKRLM